MYVKWIRVRSPSMSSYPTVGPAFHQWVFFIDDLIAALSPDTNTLLGP